MSSKTKSKYNTLEILKFIMIALVVAMDAQVLPELLYPWSCIAIPCLLLTVSYTLGRELSASKKDEIRQNEIIKSFAIKNLKYYLFWLVVTLPVTAYIRQGWFADGILSGIFLWIRNLLFGSTFAGSWYIISSVIAAVVVYKVFKKLNNGILFVIGVLLHLFATFCSSYLPLLQDNEILSAIVYYYELVLGQPYVSFPIAIFYFICGRIFAQEEELEKIGIWNWGIIFAISALVLLAEWRLAVARTERLDNLAYFSLPLVVFSIFNVAKSIRIKLPKARWLRKSGKIIYASHGALIPCIGKILEILEIYSNEGVFALTFLLCLTISSVLITMRKYYRVLKYSC